MNVYRATVIVRGVTMTLKTTPAPFYSRTWQPPPSIENFATTRLYNEPLLQSTFAFLNLIRSRDRILERTLRSSHDNEFHRIWLSSFIYKVEKCNGACSRDLGYNSKLKLLELQEIGFIRIEVEIWYILEVMFRNDATIILFYICYK